MADIWLLLQSLPSLFYVIAAAVAGMLLVYAVLSHRMKRAQRQSQQLIDQLQQEMAVMLNSASGMGEKLRELDKQCRLLQERQDQISLKEPGEQAYSHAVRLLKSGAAIETVMDQSGLSRGEIELLQRLNQAGNKAAGIEAAVS